MRTLTSTLVTVALLAGGAAGAAQAPSVVAAVKSGNAPAALRAAIGAHADVNARDGDGTSALAWAAHRDDGDSVDLLLLAGADPNLVNDYGVGALSLACENANEAIVRRLLAAGATPNVRQWTGATPLITCATTGSLPAVQALIAGGADVNGQEAQQGHSALMRAVAAQHPAVVAALLAAGADVQAHSKGGFTALLFASRQGDVDSARALLNAGADVNEVTPIDGEARRDSTGGTCVAATRKTPPNCFLPEHNPSALVLAAASGHEQMALYLLEHGADPNAADAFGWTALHYTVPDGWAAINAFFYRPFHDAFRLPEMPDLAHALLAKGANPNARVARDFSTYDISPYLIETSPVGATPFALAAAAGDVQIMQLLLAAHADPTIALANGVTPLMLAAGVGRTQEYRASREATRALDAVKLIVATGADANARDRRGHTALHGAAGVGSDAVVEFLARSGANLDVKDRDGQTPLGIASGLTKGEDAAARVYKDTAALLLRLGAEPLK